MTQRDYKTLQLSSSNHCTTITLNRPDKRNAISPVMVNELLWALHDCKANDDTRVVVLTGAGKAFCAGADISAFPSGDVESGALPAKGDFADLLAAFTTLGKPTIARVIGPALGGGLGLVASCDFAIANKAATFGTPEVRWGFFPMQIMAVLHRLMPQRKLLECMLLGETFSAEQAMSYGLLNSSVDDAELDETVAVLAQKLANSPAQTLSLGLKAFHEQADLTLREALPRLRDYLVDVLGTSDAQEGMLAFLEKRKPNWKTKV